MSTTTKATLPASKKEIQYVTEISAGVWIDLQAVKFNERSEFLIESLITSFDDSTENVMKRIKSELRAGDYMFVEQVVLELVNAENKIAGAGADEKKT